MQLKRHIGNSIDAITEEIQKIAAFDSYGELQLCPGSKWHVDAIDTCPELSKVYKSKMRVFELTSFPGVIVKYDTRGDRAQNVRRCREILEAYQLDKLVIADSTHIDIVIDGKNVRFVVEEKLAIKTGFEESKEEYLLCFERMRNDLELKDALQELFNQMAVFILETGLWDVYYANIPLISDLLTPKIALVDLNDVFTPAREDNPGHFPADLKGGSISSFAMEGLDRLLQRVHVDFRLGIVSAAANHLGIKMESILYKSAIESRTYRFYYVPYKLEDVRRGYEDMLL